MKRELIVALILSAAAGASVGGGCAELRGKPPERHQDDCTTCHGSPTRGGDALTRSAPPFDLTGMTATTQRGVGAHLIHLGDSDIAEPIECAECHVVPEAVDSPGHADDELPAEVVFGPRSKLGEAQPSYDASAIACDATYCHGGNTVSWLPSSSGEPRCARCHGDPPAAPHPADDRCHLCHGEVVDEARNIVDRALHIDGVVQAEERCDTCHGTGDLGAPPPDLQGNESISALAVGAHDAHLSGGEAGRPLECGECHQVPETVGDEGHLDPSPAEVALLGVAATDGRSPYWDRGLRRCVDSWCHGPASSTSPRWTSIEGPLDCEACHGNPPSAPHPQIADCSLCHAPVADASGGIADRTLHVDGLLQVMVPDSCDACHGSGPLGAPPPDLSGNTSPTFAGVGAHTVHLSPTGPYRPVLCEECHAVPSDALDIGHIDDQGPAELDFGGVATAFSASPSYDGASCSGTWCHGGETAFGFPSGGTDIAPVWTASAQGLLCTSCHSMPPPTPAHPAPPTFCTPCHSNIDGLGNFIDPLLHVNGVIDL